MRFFLAVYTYNLFYDGSYVQPCFGFVELLPPSLNSAGNSAAGPKAAVLHKNPAGLRLPF
jgi:hypothetical protein